MEVSDMSDTSSVKYDRVKDAKRRLKQEEQQSQKQKSQTNAGQPSELLLAMRKVLNKPLETFQNIRVYLNTEETVEEALQRRQKREQEIMGRTQKQENLYILGITATNQQWRQSIIRDQQSLGPTATNREGYKNRITFYHNLKGIQLAKSPEPPQEWTKINIPSPGDEWETSWPSNPEGRDTFEQHRHQSARKDIELEEGYQQDIQQIQWKIIRQALTDNQHKPEFMTCPYTISPPEFGKDKFLTICKAHNDIFKCDGKSSSYILWQERMNAACRGATQDRWIKLCVRYAKGSLRDALRHFLFIQEEPEAILANLTYHFGGELTANDSRSFIDKIARLIDDASEFTGVKVEWETLTEKYLKPKWDQGFTVEEILGALPFTIKRKIIKNIQELKTANKLEDPKTLMIDKQHQYQTTSTIGTLIPIEQDTNPADENLKKANKDRQRLPKTQKNEFPKNDWELELANLDQYLEEESDNANEDTSDTTKSDK